MAQNIFRIVYEKPTLFGIREKEIITRSKEAFKLINKCHKHSYHIIAIEHI